MRPWILLALPVIAGCNAILGIGGDFHVVTDGSLLASDGSGNDGPDSGPPGDAGSDGNGITCYGVLAQVCVMDPSGPVVISATVDTDADTRCVGAARCVIAGTQISVEGTVHVHGSRPLVLLATGGTITVSGTLDASSTHGGVRGAAANDASCPTTNGGTANDNGGGGGAGGSFGGRGGTGGPGTTGAPGGASSAAVVVATLRGGCPGGKGALGQMSGAIAVGGDSGGAIDLIATTSIVVSGAIFASGGGGNPNAAIRGSGAGGGTGGLIALEAPMIQNLGTVAANGGGGGGGGDLGNGQLGTDGTTSNFTIPAVGGQSEAGGKGGPGGNGGALGHDPTDGSKPQQNGGGGGGGGGLGYVWVHGTITMGGDKMSPAPALH